MGGILQKTICEQEMIYQYLRNRPCRVVSLTELCDYLGLGKYSNGKDKKDVVSRHIKALRKDHPNIKPRKDGVELVDTIPADGRVLAELASMKTELVASRIEFSELKAMVAGVVEMLAAPVVTGSGIPESGTKGKKNTTKASALDDRSPLLAAIAEAHKQGRPYTKTGRPGSNGIHARRAELPAPFCSIGRDRLERIVTELLQDGEVVQDEAGFLSVPCP
ncbi:hypothetical protein F6V30_10710 [Oryzomonas sagensis]|uniref:Uncharacterized protein n=1 Tax=Oryzomonas sagensis TaxID=2603857 RepID=A0ABQ6TLQ2_9BACT|nr:hypothetical protein [Oryzomonas sagensis]KAB0669286.1 hypothetical protein F6V30_10710 [Oryzomonas sagensis]